MFLQIGLQIFPIIATIVLLRSRYTSKLKWFTDSTVFFLGTLFAFVTARWDTTSYYLRVLLFPIFILAVVVAYHRINAKDISKPLDTRLRNSAGNFILIGALGWLNISAITGYFNMGEAVNLSFPLRDGVYYVGGGGSSRWINNHQGYPPQDYAVDILMLSITGQPVNPGNHSDLQRYAIFGQPIYSPCSGTVLIAVDGYIDRVPPERDPVNVAGNHILLNCSGVEILLAHLQQGSITVNPGDAVETGDKIGSVGNSGNTTQPHLHIHAERGGTDGEILNGVGVPITFENRFLVRNSLFTGLKNE